MQRYTRQHVLYRWTVGWRTRAIFLVWQPSQRDCFSWPQTDSTTKPPSTPPSIFTPLANMASRFIPIPRTPVRHSITSCIITIMKHILMLLLLPLPKATVSHNSATRAAVVNLVMPFLMILRLDCFNFPLSPVLLSAVAVVSLLGGLSEKSGRPKLLRRGNYGHQRMHSRTR